MDDVSEFGESGPAKIPPQLMTAAIPIGSELTPMINVNSGANGACVREALNANWSIHSHSQNRNIKARKISHRVTRATGITAACEIRNAAHSEGSMVRAKAIGM